MCHLCVHHMGRSLPANERAGRTCWILSATHAPPYNTQDMFQGVLRDDERRREKMRQRQEEFEESQRKRVIYERTQTVVSSEQS